MSNNDIDKDNNPDEINNLEKTLENKLSLVSLITEEAKESIPKNRRRELQRILKELEKQIDECCELKSEIRNELLKVQDVEKVREWNRNISKDLTSFEDVVESLNQAIEKVDDEKAAKELENKRKNLYEERLLTDKTRIPDNNISKLPHVKLPRLENYKIQRYIYGLGTFLGTV